MIAGAVVSLASRLPPAAASLALATPSHHLSHLLSVARLEPPVLLSSRSRDKLEVRADFCSQFVPSLSPFP